MNSASRPSHPALVAQPQGQAARTDRAASKNWPMLAAVFAAFLAGIIVWAEIYFSRRIGLLSGLPVFDGANYMGGAKSAFFAITSGAPISMKIARLKDIWPLMHSPLWVVAMALGFFVVGPGEWQSCLARFWPVFLFLLLIFWVVRKRSASVLAACCAICTGLLPIFSPSLSAAAWSKDKYLYLADLRPDLLSGVLLAWACAVLIEHADNLRNRAAFASGMLVGLAVLCKPSTSTGSIAVWGLLWVGLLLLNRHRFASTARAGVCALLPFLGLTGIYAAAGGYIHVKGYLQIILVQTVATWSIPDTSVWANLRFYWSGFTNEMGIEGWVILTSGIALLIAEWLKHKRPPFRLLFYLGLALAWYAMVTRIPAKNEFFGVPFYLFLWLFAVIALTPGLGRAWKTRAGRFSILVVCLLFAIYIPVRAATYLAKPPGSRELANRNRETIQQAARDLLGVLDAKQTYTAADWYGVTGGSLPFYTITPAHGILFPIIWDPSTPVNRVSSFINTRVSQSTVIYVFKEDIAEVCRYRLEALPVAYPYYRELGAWVRRPGSGFKRTKQYVLDYGNGSITLEMYIHD